MESVRDHRRTAVQSCHEIGKSFIAAEVVGWWIDTRPIGDAFVVTSAPTAKQVAAILWREIGRVHTRGELPGRVTTQDWKATPIGGKEELIAFGRKPDDYDMDAFQGIHALNVLVVFDEAGGMPAPLWEGADSLIANDTSKMLIIGNPDDPHTQFADACKKGSSYNVISVSAFDSPNFTGEPMPQRVLQQLIGPVYVEEKRKKWAPDWVWTPDGKRVIPPADRPNAAYDTHPYWQSKVLGRFPVMSNDEHILIPAMWIEAAKDRALDPVGKNELGVDVGGGGDSTTICHRQGPVFRIIEENRNPDTMQNCGLVVTKRKQLGADVVKIDTIGIGRGIVDRGLELKEPFIGVNVGRGAIEEARVINQPKDSSKEEFTNLKAQLNWHLRSLFETGQIDLDEADDELTEELAALRFKRLSSGKIQIEGKDQIKKRLGRSPNRADALVLAAADDFMVAEPGGVLTGRASW